jgi:hypothetical protein
MRDKKVEDWPFSCLAFFCSLAETMIKANARKRNEGRLSSPCRVFSFAPFVYTLRFFFQTRI